MLVFKDRSRWLWPLLLVAAVNSVNAQGQTITTDRVKPNELTEVSYQECGDRWGFAGPIADCLLEKEKAFGSHLEQVYRKALTVDTTSAPLLRESQRSWLKFQEITCKFQKVYARKEGPGVARALAARCLLLTTLQRLEELQRLFD